MTRVLCINSGSSSLKLALFDDDHEVERLSFDGSAGLQEAVQSLSADPDVVAQRVVHGGPDHESAELISDDLVEQLTALIPLAPLHLPPALVLIAEARKAFGNARHVACFDTAFHRTMPEIARRYPLPAQFGVEHFGFHGLSCQHVVDTVPPEKLKRAVIAHLGSGCSVTALRDGASVETSMGFSPSGGVVMATRPGDLDPGLVLYLAHHHGDGLSDEINKQSGLQALAGSHDMRELLQRTDAAAELAVAMFCRTVAQRVAGYAVTLGGIDTLVFTGGIGEHASVVRDRIVDELRILGPFEVLVIAANEELAMARQALAVIQSND